MWAAQISLVSARWVPSEPLDDLRRPRHHGYGTPASIGVQVAHPDALVINVAGEASWLMNHAGVWATAEGAQYRPAGQRSVIHLQ